uniref:RWP-RK domain-containing protein n=1 Tax=Guillardia theta TaxID=55529 RepID=A0A7S4HBQ9_GUITH|mmetsp:Transcript_13213/g.46267  ORF Transcript_13213/g.46267 Transcript_13213/m.46267 type:complete len:400 (+) Transcript_13213:101-1300(+)
MSGAEEEAKQPQGVPEDESKDSHHEAPLSSGGRERVPDFSEIQRHFDKPEKQAAAQLGICLTSLKKICRAQNVRRWPYRKIHSINKRGHVMTEEEILLYCQSEAADRSPSPSSSGPNTPSAAADSSLWSMGDREEGDVDDDGGNESKGEGEAKDAHPHKLDEQEEANAAKRGRRASDEGEEVLGEGETSRRLIPSVVTTCGRRIRYKFVCTPPEGYVPSELDASTLPRSFFSESKDVCLFSLKKNENSSFNSPRSYSRLRESADGHPMEGDGEQEGLQAGGEGDAADPSMQHGAGEEGQTSAGGPNTAREMLPVRQGPIGSHLCDAVVFCAAVARDLEARKDVLPLPFNCQPPKKRYRPSFGYITEQQSFFQIRNIPARSPSPNSLSAQNSQRGGAAYR